MDQCPHARSNVSPHGFYKAAHSNLPHSFFNLLDPAKLEEGVTPRLLRRQALPEVRFRQHIQVCLDFFTELLVHPVLVDQVARSEEHTSELQSQSNLVCRLLLEKKKLNI